MSAFSAAAQDEDGDTIKQLRGALQQARDWITEHPDRRPISAGRMVAILTNALAAASQPPVVEQPQGEQAPVAWIENIGGGVSYNHYHEAARKLPDGVRFDLYTHPQPQREPLTEADLYDIAGNYFADEWAQKKAVMMLKDHGIGGEA